MDSSVGGDAALEERIHQQEVVAELGQRALEIDDVDRLMNEACVAVSETLDTEFTKVLELCPNGEAVFLRQGVGWRDGLVGEATVPTDRDSQAGYTLVSAEPVIVEDLGDETRFSGPELLTSHDVTSGISVIVGSVDDPWGVLGTHSTDRRAFTTHDANFVQSVANVLAGAIEQARAERELRDREGELERTLDRITDGFLGLDAAWTITYANEHGTEILDPEDVGLVGRNFWEAFEPALGTTFEEEYREAMRSQEPTSFEEYYPPLGVWFEVHAYPSASGLSIYFRDVTDRKARERKLEESERRYRTLAECFPNGIVTLFDADLEYTLAAGRAFERLPVSPDDIEGETPQEIWPEPATEALVPAMRAALDGAERTVELSYADREWEIHVVPVTHEAGDVFAGMTMAQDVTERNWIERELRESERKFRQIAEHLEEVIWLSTPDKRQFHYVNPAYEEVWGRRVEAIYENPADFLEGIHPDDRDRVRAALETQVDGEYDERYRVVRPDGTTRIVRDRAFPIENDDGTVYRIVGIAADITERTEYERRLEESERRYRALAEHVPNGAVGVFDHDLRFTLAEGAVLGETLPEAEYFEGERISDAFVDDAVADLESLFRAAVADGVTGSRTTTFDGRHWEVWATPLRDGAGEIFAGLTFAQDVTDRRERERELERALDLLEKTERIADVAGWEIDPGRDDIFWSDHLFDLLEVPYDEQPSLEQALDVYYTDDDRAMISDAIEEATASGEPFDVEARFQKPSGEVGWLRVQGDPEVAGGEVRTLRGAVQDVTERKKRERRLTELIDVLEESNARLEQFAYAASHDLQEPLRMVSSYLQLIEQRYADVLDEDGEEFLEYAVDGADRMREMIEGLLEYSRVGSRGEPLEPVDLDDVLEDVLADLRIRIRETDAEITVESLPRVLADRSQLQQVFQNLLGNAIEYSGDGPPRITVAADRRNDEYVISVRDAGIGIDPAESDRVFELFGRLHTRDKHEGTGIGLALVERIVERHGGEIWVDSAPGEGATFSFTLPAADEDGI